MAVIYSLGSRVLALLILLVSCAYPVRILLVSPEIPVAVHVAWLALAALGWARPRWSPVIVVALAPLVPMLPMVLPSVPAAIVHLLVLSQALPFLIRVVLGRLAPPRDAGLACWALVVVVALLAMATRYATYRLGVGSSSEFWRELGVEAWAYVFQSPGSAIAPMLVAMTTLVDGLLAYALVRTLATGAAWRWTLVGVASAAVVVAGFGLFQARTSVALSPFWTQLDPGITRINATYTDPNALAAYFALTIPVVAGLAGGSAGRVRLGWIGALVPMFVALMMSGGRMGLLATGLGLVVLVGCALWCRLDAVEPWMIVRRHARAAVRWAALAGAAAIAVLTIVGTSLDVRHGAQTSYLRLWLYTLNLRQPPDDIAKGRFDIWRTTARIVVDQPAFGVGPGRIFDEYARYRTGTRFDPRMRLSAHSTFLLFAAELGMVGLAAWALLVAVVLRLAFDPGQLRPRDPETWVALGIGAGLLAYAVTMLTGDRTILREDVAMFAAVSALAAGRGPGVWVGPVQKTVAVVILCLLVTWPARTAHAQRTTDLLTVTEGLSDWKADERGVPFRWTKSRAVFYVPAGATTLTLPLRKEADFVQRVRVVMDGRVADEVRLATDDWTTVKYVFRQVPGDLRYHKVVLEITPPWRRPYYPVVGVMLGDYKWK